MFQIGQVAQSVEQRTENPRVGGSIPSLTKDFELSHPLENIHISSIVNMPFRLNAKIFRAAVFCLLEDKLIIFQPESGEYSILSMGMPMGKLM